MASLTEKIIGSLNTIFNLWESENGLTAEQEDAVLKKAHDRSAELDKLEGLESSASKIDNNTLKKFNKVVKEFNKNPIDGDFQGTYNAYANAYNYNNEEFNAVKVFVKVKESTTLKVMIMSKDLEPGINPPNWWKRTPLTKGEVLVTPNDRYIIVPLEETVNIDLVNDDYFYISISTEDSNIGVQLASHNCEITDYNDNDLPDMYAVTTMQTNTTNGYRFLLSNSQDSFCKFWFKMLYIDYDGLRTEKIEQDLKSVTKKSKIVHYPNFYNCEGLEAHIYFNNFKKSLIDIFGYKYYCKAYDFRVLESNHIGKQEDERFIKSNASLVMGAKEEIANINFYESFYQNLYDTVRFKHITVKASNGNGQTCNFVAIGESTTANGAYVNRMVEIATTDVLTFVPLGTRTDGGTLHEGVGGKTMNWHVNAVESAFTDSNGNLDYSRFVSTVGVTPDVLSIQLGINAMLTVKYKYELEYYIDREMTAYSNFIAHVKLTHPNTKFIINTCILPSELQSAFGKNYDTYLNRDNYRENIQSYNEALIELFKDREDENIYLNCTQTLQLDCRYGFPFEEQALSALTTTTVVRGTNAVHPASYGYDLMGDGLWACLKYLYK